MNLTNEFNPIRIWAAERGILQKSTPEKQYIKFCEEVGEIAKEVLSQDKHKLALEIGDAVVCLTNLAELSGLTIEECINSAYQKIANRKGEMQNGTFVKVSPNIPANCCGNCKP